MAGKKEEEEEGKNGVVGAEEARFMNKDVGELGVEAVERASNNLDGVAGGDDLEEGFIK